MDIKGETGSKDSQKQLHIYEELQGPLRRVGLSALPPDTDGMPIALDGKKLCTVDQRGHVRYREEDALGERRSAAMEKVEDLVRNTVQYLRQVKSAPLLHANGLEGDYRLLAEFNDTVLAGHPTRLGVQFITWQRTYDGTGLWQGHYYHQDYKAAKEDFAIRAGLVSREKLFSPEQLTEVYRCIHETLESEYPMTAERSDLLHKAAEQIERTVPDLSQRVEQSNAEEFQADSMTQQLSI